jgi:hypothetical protein
MVAQVYNPSYLGDRDQGAQALRPIPAKNLQDLISTNKKLGVMVWDCHPSCVASINRKISV